MNLNLKPDWASTKIEQQTEEIISLLECFPLSFQIEMINILESNLLNQTKKDKWKVIGTNIFLIAFLKGLL